ncbi:hypothetical protein BaRGS_00005005, partial [Batillaria attramentaria]
MDKLCTHPVLLVCEARPTKLRYHSLVTGRAGEGLINYFQRTLAPLSPDPEGWAVTAALYVDTGHGHRSAQTRGH